MDNSIKVVFPGTFDPITNGHMDIIKRADKIFDGVIVGVARNTGKTPLFSYEERLAITREAIEACRSLSGVKVYGIEGLLVDFAEEHGARVIIRGLRAVSDFEYELQMAFMNRDLNENIEIMYMMPYIKYSFLSSSIVRNVFLSGGRIEKFVPRVVIRHLEDKVKKLKGE